VLDLLCTQIVWVPGARGMYLVGSDKDEKHDDGDICGGRSAVGNLACDTNEQRAAEHASHPNQQ